MRKIKAFFTALLLFFIYVFFDICMFKKYEIEKIRQMKDQLNYNYDFEKFNCTEAVEQNLKDENVILVLCSSEVSDINEFDPTCLDSAHPKWLFNRGNSNFNFMMFGRGYNKCLNHSIHIGAFSNIMKNKKVVLLLSPQWFSESDTDPMTFSSTFYPRMFDKFIKNPNLDNNLKQRVISRSKELLAGYPFALNRVKRYEQLKNNVWLNPFANLSIFLTGQFLDTRYNRALSNKVKPLNPYSPQRVLAENIDYNALLKTVEQEGASCCTNNQFCIYNDYYSCYIKDSAKLKNSWKRENFIINKREQEDLRLFLDTCDKLGIESLIVSLPFNAYWNDHIGFSTEYREQCYESVREVMNEYPAARFLDLTKFEYEKYFVRDTMHLAWKGWVKVDQATYEFYKKDKG